MTTRIGYLNRLAAEKGYDPAECCAVPEGRKHAHAREKGYTERLGEAHGLILLARPKPTPKPTKKETRSGLFKRIRR